MVKCTFCGTEMDKGTGKMYVKIDGTIYYFCTSKCEKNMLKLKRISRNVPWTEESRKFKGKVDQK